MSGGLLNFLLRKLHPVPMWPRRTCRQVTRLVLMAEDRALPWHERVAVRLHMRICIACPRFLAQVRFMREAMGPWRHYREQGD